MRRGCTVPIQLTWRSTKISDEAETFVTTGSVDGCSVLPDDRLSGWLQRPVGDPACREPPARWNHTSFLCMGFPSFYWSCRREAKVWRQTVFSGSNHGLTSRLSPEVFSTRGYIHKTAGVWNQKFHSPTLDANGYPFVCYTAGNIVPSWSSTTNISLSPFAVNALRVDFSEGASLIHLLQVDLPAISGARVVDNGVVGVMTNYIGIPMLYFCINIKKF